MAMSVRSLALEDYVFQIFENQARLFEYLNVVAPEWHWNADLGKGVLSFQDNVTGRTLASCSAFLIGSRSDRDGSFLWGWANSSVTPLPTVAKRWREVQEAARKKNDSGFLSHRPLVLNEESDAMALAIIIVGFMQGFTFYAGGYGGGDAFLGIESCPEAETIPVDILFKVRVMSMALTTLSFHHKTAVLAYLGEPLSKIGNIWEFPVGDAHLQVSFDDQGRIINFGTRLTPDNIG